MKHVLYSMSPYKMLN